MKVVNRIQIRFQLLPHILSHVISQEGCKPDPDKVSTITTYPIPNNVHDLRASLGVCFAIIGNS